MKKINIKSKKWLIIGLISLFVLGIIGAIVFNTVSSEAQQRAWYKMDAVRVLARVDSEEAKLPDELTANWESGMDTVAYKKAADSVSVFNQEADSQGVRSDLLKNKKIIRNAELDIETKNVLQTYKDIIDFAKANGGYEFNKNITVRNDYERINAVIKISPKNLDAFLQFISKNSDVINCNVSSQDITDEYFDTALRLKSMRNSLQAYYTVLEKAKTINEILTVKSKIDEVTMEIESLEGRLKYWDNFVSESTVTLTVSAKNDPLRVKKDINWTALSLKDMGQLIKNGFLGAINILVTIVQWLIIGIITVLPIAIIAAILVWVIIVIIKKQRDKRKDI